MDFRTVLDPHERLVIFRVHFRPCNLDTSRESFSNQGRCFICYHTAIRLDYIWSTVKGWSCYATFKIEIVVASCSCCSENYFLYNKYLIYRPVKRNCCPENMTCVRLSLVNNGTQYRVDDTAIWRSWMLGI